MKKIILLHFANIRFHQLDKNEKGRIPLITSSELQRGNFKAP